jgi:ankyrin repeat protein
MAAQGVARAHGLPVDETAAALHAGKTLVMMSGLDFVIQSAVDAIAYGYISFAAEGAGIQQTMTLAAAAKRVANFQLTDGHWPVGDGRPPHSYSPFTATALCVRLVSLHLPATMIGERDRSRLSARRWLLANRPESTEDAAFQLLGLKWSGATLAERRSAADAIVARQRADGGWSQMDGMESDAYSTGQVLYALREAGEIPAERLAVRWAMRYLVQTQLSDGSWHVKTRLHSKAPISPPFFDSGFPNGKDQFISCAGTAWAVMGLAAMLPPVSNPAKALPVPLAEPRDVEPWLATALFGSTADLQKLLDSGLDPNSTTREGTSLLMMAAPAADKVRLLLDRGARVDRAAKSGLSALAVTAGMRQSAAAVKLLLDHGATVNPGDTRPEQKPLFQASLAGDLETIRLLIDRGAEVNAMGSSQTPLVTAVQYGDADLIRLLARAGAEIDQADPDSKLTPLAIAAIMHKTEAAAALLEAGANPASIDKFGMTALEHTGDIAFADPRTGEVIRRAAAPSRAGLIQQLP